MVRLDYQAPLTGRGATQAQNRLRQPALKPFNLSQHDSGTEPLAVASAHITQLKRAYRSTYVGATHHRTACGSQRPEHST